MRQKRAPVNDASLCRVRGWHVGDILRREADESTLSSAEIHAKLSDPTRFVTYHKITAIGEKCIVVRQRKASGKFGPERLWSRQLLHNVITRAEACGLTG